MGFFDMSNATIFVQGDFNFCIMQLKKTLVVFDKNSCKSWL